jgi:hypothetical protein
MKVSENTLKWGMSLYPPLLLQRIWIRSIDAGFRGADVKIIYAATDPFYAMLFGQLLKHKGYHISVWLKSASIQFLRPGRTNLYYRITITDEMINEVEKELNNKGVFVKSYTIEIYSKTGDLYAIAKNEIYIRKK